MDEAHIVRRDYSKEPVETLPIENFRRQYGDIPFKKIGGSVIVSHKDDNDARVKFNRLEDGIVRFIPFCVNAAFADGAVVFDDKGNPIMEITGHAIRAPGLGVFYMAQNSHMSQADCLVRIYEDAKVNPVC